MYKLSNLAADDFAGIYDYTLEHFGEDQADRYTDSLEEIMQAILQSPQIGHECPEIAEGIRRLDAQRHSIFYRIREHDIFIVRILHQQMDVPRSLLMSDY